MLGKESIELGTKEIVAYHKAKRKFINLKDIESIDPDLIQIYEFNGQDFDLLAYDRRNWDNYPGIITCSIGLSVGGEPLKEPGKTTVTFLVPIIAALNTVTIARNELSLLFVSLYHPESRPPPSKATIAFFGALYFYPRYNYIIKF